LGYSKRFFINAVIFGLVFAFYSVSAILADRIGRMLIYATIAIAYFGFVFSSKFRKFFSSNVFFMLGNDFGFYLWPLPFYQNYFQPMFDIQGTSLAFGRNHRSICAYDCYLATV
jgi:hypothetical protein